MIFKGAVKFKKIMKYGKNIEKILAQVLSDQPISWIDSGYPEPSLLVSVSKSSCHSAYYGNAK